jgi:hypothetical protein
MVPKSSGYESTSNDVVNECKQMPGATTPKECKVGVQRPSSVTPSTSFLRCRRPPSLWKTQHRKAMYRVSVLISCARSLDQRHTQRTHCCPLTEPSRKGSVQKIVAAALTTSLHFSTMIPLTASLRPKRCVFLKLRPSRCQAPFRGQCRYLRQL